MNLVSKAAIDEAMKQKKRAVLICGNCGLVNDYQRVSSQKPGTEASWLECIPFQGSERKNIPVGAIPLPGTSEDVLWVDLNGKSLSRIDFIKIYGRDPKVWWKKYMENKLKA